MVGPAPQPTPPSPLPSGALFPGALLLLLPQGAPGVWTLPGPVTCQGCLLVLGGAAGHSWVWMSEREGELTVLGRGRWGRGAGSPRPCVLRTRWRPCVSWKPGFLGPGASSMMLGRVRGAGSPSAHLQGVRDPARWAAGAQDLLCTDVPLTGRSRRWFGLGGAHGVRLAGWRQAQRLAVWGTPSGGCRRSCNHQISCLCLQRLPVRERHRRDGSRRVLRGRTAHQQLSQDGMGGPPASIPGLCLRTVPAPQPRLWSVAGGGGGTRAAQGGHEGHRDRVDPEEAPEQGESRAGRRVPPPPGPVAGSRCLLSEGRLRAGPGRQAVGEAGPGTPGSQLPALAPQLLSQTGLRAAGDPVTHSHLASCRAWAARGSSASLGRGRSWRRSLLRPVTSCPPAASDGGQAAVRQLQDLFHRPLAHLLKKLGRAGLG